MDNQDNLGLLGSLSVVFRLLTTVSQIHNSSDIIHYSRTEQNRTYALPVVGMGPSWPSIDHGHSGITAHLDTATFNVCETLNLGV